MGLLDGLFSQDPQSQGILALASGLLSNRGNFGQNAGASMQQGQQAFNVGMANQRQDQYRQAQEEWYRQRGAEQQALAQKQQAAQDRADAQAQSQGDAQNALISALTPPDNSASPNPFEAQKQWAPDRLAVERALAQYNPQAMIPSLLGRYGIGQPPTAAHQPTGQEAEMAAYLRLNPQQQAQWDRHAHPPAPPDPYAALAAALAGRGPAPAAGSPQPSPGAIPPMPGQTPQPPGASQPTIDASLPKGVNVDALNKLIAMDPGAGGLVKQVVAGQIGLIEATGRSGKSGASFKNLVMAVDPTFNTGRNKVYAGLTSGEDSKNITALNTAVGHMATLGQITDEMANNPSTGVNHLINWAKQVTSDPTISSFDVARNAVAGEMAKVFRSSGMSEQEINDWRMAFDRDKGINATRAALSTGAGLLQSRIEALGSKADAVGLPRPNIINGHAKEAYDVFTDPNYAKNGYANTLKNRKMGATGTQPPVAPANNDGWSIVR